MRHRIRRALPSMASEGHLGMHRQSMSRNFVQLAVASVVGSGLGIVTSAFLARVLGVSGFGVLSLGRTMMDYILLPMSLGIMAIGSREISASSDRKGPIAGDVLLSRLIMSGLSAVALLATAVLVLDPQLRQVLLVLSLMIPLQLVNLDWLYNAYESQWLPSIARPAGKVVYAVGTFLLVRGPNQLWIAAAMLVLELAIMVAILGPKAWSLIDLRGSIRERIRDASAHIMHSLPAGLANLGGRIKTNIDVLMLGAMSTSLAVGYYSAAYRLVYFVQTFAGLYAMVLLPRLSRSVEAAEEDTRDVVASSVRAALTACAAVLGIVAPLGAEIMVLLFGVAYRPAAPVMVPLVVASAAFIVSMTLGHAVLGLRYDRFYASAAWAAAVVNIGINLYVIPRWSFYGAAASTLVTEVALAAVFVFRLWGVGVNSVLSVRRVLAFVVVVSGTAGAGRLLLVWSGTVIIAVIGASVVWLGLAFAVGVVTRDDVARLKGGLAR